MNCVVVGAGRMGRRHIEVLKSLNIELIGVVDTSIDSLKIVKEQFMIKDDLTYLSLEEFLENNIPDFAIIATTADSHFSLTCILAEFGVKFILVEKPFAISLEQAKKMLEICNNKFCKIAVNHQMRYINHYLKIKEIINNKNYGGLRSITITTGNFGFSMNAIHYFELFRFMTDENPYEVTAWFSNENVKNPRGEQFEDKAGCIRITSKSGKRLYIDASADHGHGIIVNYFARNGFIISNELTGEINYTVRENEYLNLPTTRYAMPSDSYSEKIPIDDIILSTSHLIHDLLYSTNYVSGDFGFLSLMTLVAAYESAMNDNKSIILTQTTLFNKEFPWA